MIVEVMKESIPGLQILAFVGLLAVVLFGALFYFAEAGHWRPPGRHGYRMWDDDESSWTNYTDGVFTRSDYTGTSAEVRVREKEKNLLASIHSPPPPPTSRFILWRLTSMLITDAH